MYAIFTRHDRVTPRDVVPTDEEGVELLGTMVAYAGTFSLGENVVVHHIDTSWNQAWTGTDQIALRHFKSIFGLPPTATCAIFATNGRIS